MSDVVRPLINCAVSLYSFCLRHVKFVVLVISMATELRFTRGSFFSRTPPLEVSQQN